MGWLVATASEKLSREVPHEDTDTRAVHIVNREAQWTQPWLKLQSQVNVIHLVRSTGAIVSNPHKKLRMQETIVIKA